MVSYPCNWVSKDSPDHLLVHALSPLPSPLSLYRVYDGSSSTS